MERLKDLKSWHRKDHFDFFRQFEEPFFGVTVHIDCSEAYALAKQHSISFFLMYLHSSLVAANKVEEFRYRIRDNEVVVYDEVHASSTINRPDNTFGFSYINFREDFEEFTKVANKEIERVRNSTGLEPADAGQNVIHYSVIPWLHFTSLSHARSFSFPDSCPKITFGKILDENGKKKLPVSIHAHHALMDGYHVGQFVELFEQLLNREV